MIDCNALALGRKVTIHINNYTIAETPNPHPPGDLNIDDQSIDTYQSTKSVTKCETKQ